MRPLPISALACLFLAAPLHAQAIGPRPARAVWLAAPAAPRSVPVDTLDQHARSAGCDNACRTGIGTGIGILVGGLAGFYVSAIRDSRSALPVLAGVVIGGLAGAAIASGPADPPTDPAKR